MQSSAQTLFRELRRLEQDVSIESHGEPTTPSDIEWFIWIGGSRADVEASLQRTLEALQGSCPQESVAFLLDGSETRQWEAVAACLPRFPNRREITLHRAAQLPALLYASGLRDSRAAWAAFLWPGCDVKADAIFSLRNRANGADLVYAGFSTTLRPFTERAPAGWVLGDSGQSHEPSEISHPVEYGWLQMADCLPMNGCLLSIPFARGAAPFEANPLLGGLFWWEATRRIARQGRIAHAAAPLPSARWNWDAFPFRSTVDIPAELSARFLSRPPRIGPSSAEVAAADVEAFTNDLPAEEGLSLATALAAWESRIGSSGAAPGGAAPTPIPGSTRRPKPFPIRVTVLGGPYEPHHNQIYFFNFFELAAGRGDVSWKTLLYQTCQPADLEASDLVVFSRPRYGDCGRLLESCGRRGTATLVMIDDNWIAAGREFRQYENLFTPGKPALETFLGCLARADATLLYNELLEEDLRPFARQIHRLPPNVNTALFRPEAAPGRPEGFLAGYAGSPRSEAPAFRALAELARRHSDVHLLAMAHTRPPEWGDVSPDRILFVPFCVDYRRYARTIASLRPDVMVAPLDGSRFSASKCPIKFLELSAAGAAGIYSDVRPYNRYVESGHTGLLVNDSEEAWLEALEDLRGNPARRVDIARRAHEEVFARFDTSRILDPFLAFLGTLVGRTPPGPALLGARA